MTFDEMVQDIRDSVTPKGVARAYDAAMRAVLRLFEAECEAVGLAEAIRRMSPRENACYDAMQAGRR